ncbi:MAG: hypothetical protein ACRC2B_22760 [Rubrivivax sp.]
MSDVQADGTEIELDDAPPSVHVKRTAQQSFGPAALDLRALGL